nr:arginase family protein [Meiothermus sp. QL-1]
MRSSELPFTGPATFLKAPHRPLSEPWTADVGFLGIPYDFAVGYRPGARFAPGALREASGRYAPGPEGFFDLETETYRLQGVSLVDVGDVDPAQPGYAETFRRISEAALKLRKRVRLPVFVGGDHSVSYPILQAYADLDSSMWCSSTPTWTSRISATAPATPTRAPSAARWRRCRASST